MMLPFLDFQKKILSLHLRTLDEEDILKMTAGGIAPLPLAQPTVIPQIVTNLEAAGSAKFRFGKTSLDRLDHVRIQLRNMALRAITLSTVDMTVVQTIRSIEEQRRNVANGNSRTMKSKHLPQPPDGLADAMDIAAWVDGTISWNEVYYADIAFAMDRAATELGFAKNIRWGAAWDRVLSDFGGTHDAYLAEARAYAKRHAGSDLIDMPHFEWVA